MVRLLTTIEGIGPTTYTRTVLVFRADSWEAAWLRAIELGRRAEAVYRNPEGREVSRRLLRVETLDMLGDQIDDGREVYSEPAEAGIDATTTLTTVRPEDSRPTQSGV